MLIPHHIKAFTAGLMLLIFLFNDGLPARGQVTTRRGAQEGRRVGGVVLPTPPFNPDAGILNAPKARRVPPAKAVSRRPNRRKAKIDNRHPLPGTPRKRRMRRGQQRR
jgi:hypothetical protein